ncbi:MAG: hypothetical protein ABI867_17080 [Kofleriaceae bacterium]
MRETKRVIRSSEALDDVSDHMGEILRRADELLAEWKRFGGEVRVQVDREAQQVANAVANAVDGAVARATAASVDRTLADQIGGKLAALSAEIAKLETRARAASRAIGEERRGDRRVLWGVAAGVLIANVLLAIVLLRKPAEPVVLPPAPEATRVEAPVLAPPVPVDAAVTPEPVVEEPKPEPTKAGSAAKPAATVVKPVKTGPPGAKLLAAPPLPRRK